MHETLSAPWLLPDPASVEGPSFPPMVKGLATVLVVGRRPWDHVEGPAGLRLLAYGGKI